MPDSCRWGAAPAATRGRHAALVVAVHALLLLALAQQTATRPGRVELPPPVVTFLRLLAAPEPSSALPGSPRRAAPPSPREAAPAVAPRVPAPAADEQPPPAPVASSVTPVSPLDLGAAVRAAAASAARSGRNPALDDPRANSAPLPRSIEAHIAEALAGEDGPIVEQDLGGGLRRFRRGRACVVVRDTRAATLDPFNPATRTTKVVEPCR